MHQARFPASLRRLPVLLFTVVLAAAGALAVPVLASAADEKPSSAEEKPRKVKPIDVNKATAKELIKLPRIGPVVARRIIDYRKAVGPFRKIDELLNVKGIGERTLAILRPLVTLTLPEKGVGRSRQ